MIDSVKIAAIVWYTSDTYVECREVMSDKARLPRTFLAWQKKSESQARRAISEGYRLYRIALEAKKFRDWCEEKGVPPNATARIEFATVAIRERHLHARSAAPVRTEKPSNAVALWAKKPADLLARTSLHEAREISDSLVGLEGEARASAAARLGELLQSTQTAMQHILEEKTVLAGHLAQAESEAVRLAEFNERIDDYVKVKVAPNTSVYRERNSNRYGNAAFFCPKCFDKKRLSVLEGHPFGTCRVCNFATEITWRTSM